MRIIKLLTDSDKEWLIIKKSPPSFYKLLFFHLVPVYFVFIIFSFISTLLYNYHTGYLLQIVYEIILSFILIFLNAVLINLLSEFYDGEKDYSKALVIVGYCQLAFLIAAPFILIPFVRNYINLIIAVVNILLLRKGIRIVLDAKKNVTFLSVIIAFSPVVLSILLVVPLSIIERIIIKFFNGIF